MTISELKQLEYLTKQWIKEPSDSLLARLKFYLSEGLLLARSHQLMRINLLVLGFASIYHDWPKFFFYTTIIRFSININAASITTNTVDWYKNNATFTQLIWIFEELTYLIDYDNNIIRTNQTIP